MSTVEGEYDYRHSHVNTGRGAYYDRLYRPGRALAFYWDHFEEPFLRERFAALRDRHPAGRYLDFACGTGRILQVGASFFADATGVDVSEAMLERARAKVPGARIVQADVLSDPIDLGRFDVVTLFRFLLRAGSLREPVLRYLRNVISDDGVLIVNNHRNARSLRGLSYRVAGRIRPNGFEGDLLTDRDMRDLLRRTGFTVEERFSFGVIPSWHGRLLAPSNLLLAVERRSSTSLRLQGATKNRIYVCSPSRSRT
jgi:SAM-dependent methyltransferase